jgi:hypothetical protein
LEDFVSEAEEAELLELIEAAPRSRWTQLRARSLQNWGGHPRAVLLARSGSERVFAQRCVAQSRTLPLH